MNRENVDKALTGLEAFNGYLGEVYESIRSSLVDDLSISGLHLESARVLEAQKRQNYRLVTDFVRALPKSTERTFDDRYYKRDSIVIEAEDPYIARLIPVHVLWVNIRQSLTENVGLVTPFYIVGKKNVRESDNSDPRDTKIQLLLCSTNPGASDAFRVASVWKNELEISQENAAKKMYESFTRNDIDRMLNTNTGNLRITSGGSSMRTNLSDQSSLIKRMKFRSKPEVVLKKGMNVFFDNYTFSGEYRLSDEDLALYDVFTHLNHLALAFRKVDHLQDLLENYKVKVQEDPIDELFEP